MQHVCMPWTVSVKLVYVQHLSLCFVASFAVGLAGVLDLNL